MDDFENNRTRQLRHYDTPQVSGFKPCCPRCFSSHLVEPTRRVIDGEYYYLTTLAVKPDSSPRPILSHASRPLWWCQGCGFALNQSEAVELKRLDPVSPLDDDDFHRSIDY